MLKFIQNFVPAKFSKIKTCLNCYILRFDDCLRVNHRFLSQIYNTVTNNNNMFLTTVSLPLGSASSLCRKKIRRQKLKAYAQKRYVCCCVLAFCPKKERNLFRVVHTHYVCEKREMFEYGIGVFLWELRTIGCV